MNSRFLVRFDDICPTMNWTVWSDIERILDAQGIQPLVAVVPDNQDQHLRVGPALPNFWDRVRDWQQRGWSIGWHGYQHLYAEKNAGLVGVHSGSEFAGASEEEQRDRLDSAARIFREQGVTPAVWIAPGHSFDWTTVRLLREHGVTAISDGYFLRPVRWNHSVWVPQQLWRFRKMRIGLWTVCYHHNSWHDRDLEQFETDVVRFRRQIVSLTDVLGEQLSPYRWWDGAFAAAYRRVVLARSALH
jgi:predicted deacetylase